MTQKNSDEAPDTLSVIEAARRLGIGRDNAYRGCKTGEIPCIRIGGRIVIPRAALERLLSDGQEPQKRRSAA